MNDNPIDKTVSDQAAKSGVLPMIITPPAGNGLGEETMFFVLPRTTVSPTQPDNKARKPKKHPQLWQAYQWFHTIQELRKAYLLRISAIDRGASSMDAIFEKEMAQQLGMAYLVEAGATIKQLEKAALKGVALDLLLDNTKKIMVNYGSTVPVWDWVTGIKGLGEGSLAAQLLAQIDDINQSPTVASLWRFAGFSVENGQAEVKGKRGEKRHYNGLLKGICFNIADQFIRQQTPEYIGIYYAEKAKQREKHPDPFCLDCQLPAEIYQKKDSKTGEMIWACRCPERKKDHTVKYSDIHIHTMAWRKMVKAFLKNLYVEWKKAEGNE